MIAWMVHEYTGHASHPAVGLRQPNSFEYELRQAGFGIGWPLPTAGPRLRGTPPIRRRVAQPHRPPTRGHSPRRHPCFPPNARLAAQIEAIVRTSSLWELPFGDTAGTHSAGDIELRRPHHS